MTQQNTPTNYRRMYDVVFRQMNEPHERFEQNMFETLPGEPPIKIRATRFPLIEGQTRDKLTITVGTSDATEIERIYEPELPVLGNCWMTRGPTISESDAERVLQAYAINHSMGDPR